MPILFLVIFKLSKCGTSEHQSHNSQKNYDRIMNTNKNFFSTFQSFNMTPQKWEYKLVMAKQL